ncbi:GH32 C-terminal domain-containing protein, partial [Streptomyces mirabilis]
MTVTVIHRSNCLVRVVLSQAAAARESGEGGSPQSEETVVVGGGAGPAQQLVGEGGPEAVGKGRRRAGTVGADSRRGAAGPFDQEVGVQQEAAAGWWRRCGACGLRMPRRMPWRSVRQVARPSWPIRGRRAADVGPGQFPLAVVGLFEPGKDHGGHGDVGDVPCVPHEVARGRVGGQDDALETRGEAAVYDELRDVLADGVRGEAVITDQIFPDPASQGVQFFAENGSVKLDQ